MNKYVKVIEEKKNNETTEGILDITKNNRNNIYNIKYIKSLLKKTKL